jgi:hypothetical protein
VTLRVARKQFESYEVFDERGNPVGRVVLPKSPRLFGPERRTVFLDRGPGRATRVSVSGTR